MVGKNNTNLYGLNNVETIIIQKFSWEKLTIVHYCYTTLYTCDK